MCRESLPWSCSEYEWSGYLTTLASIAIEDITSPMETTMQEDSLHLKEPLQQDPSQKLQYSPHLLKRINGEDQ